MWIIPLKQIYSSQSNSALNNHLCISHINTFQWQSILNDANWLLIFVRMDDGQLITTCLSLQAYKLYQIRLPAPLLCQFSSELLSAFLSAVRCLKRHVFQTLFTLWFRYNINYLSSLKLIYNKRNAEKN